MHLKITQEIIHGMPVTILAINLNYVFVTAILDKIVKTILTSFPIPKRLHGVNFVMTAPVHQHNRDLKIYGNDVNDKDTKQ